MSSGNGFIPNSFQVPNVVIDELMADLSLGELKCYLVTIRKTKGWNKECDAISISQFMKLTGLSNRVVIQACKSLVEHGLLVKRKGPRSINVFSINMCKKVTSDEKSHVTKSHATYDEKSQDPMTKSHTQTNNKNTIQNTINRSVHKKPDSITKRNTKPEAFKQFFEEYPAHRKGGTDLTAWKKWKSKNLTDQDAQKALEWLRASALGDPQTWGANSKGQYALGITKFIDEQTWLTPPRQAMASSGAPYSQPLEMGGDDIAWAEGLTVEISKG